MYKLTKTFVSKWKQQKGKDLGGGVRKDTGLGGARVQEGDEFAPLKMSRTVHEQVKQFKVSLGHSLTQSVTHSPLLPSSTRPLTRTLTRTPIPPFFPPAHAHSLAHPFPPSSLQEHLPVVHILCNPGLRQRHWEKMSDIIGFNITPNSGTSLRKMIKSVQSTPSPCYTRVYRCISRPHHHVTRVLIDALVGLITMLHACL